MPAKFKKEGVKDILLRCYTEKVSQTCFQRVAGKSGESAIVYAYIQYIPHIQTLSPKLV